MSDDDKKGGTIRVPDDTKKSLEGLAERMNMKQSEIVAYLVDQCLKFRMLDPENPDWYERVRAEIREEIAETDRGDEKVRTAITIAEHRAVLNSKTTVFKTHLKDMPIEERRALTAKLLGMRKDTDNPAGYLEAVSSLQLFKINGVRQFHAADRDGMPILKGVAPAEIVSCAGGLHVRLARCDCPLWRACKYRIEEQAERDKKFLENVRRLEK